MRLAFVCFMTIIASASIACTSKALAESPAPEVVVNRLYLEPRASLAEESNGTFGPILWAAGLKTRFSNWFDAQILVGSSQLLFRPNWSTAPAETVSLVEGYGQGHFGIGDFYAGQFLVPWGLQGQTQEENLFLPRTLLYELGYFPLRDVGAGFKTENDGFYMNVAGHNGEGAGMSNVDNRAFATGQFGYKGAAHTNVGFGLAAGRVTAPLLTPERRIRGGNAFFGFNVFGLGLQIEGSYFQTFTDAGDFDVMAWNADVEHPITDSVNLIARYEQLNPNVKGAAGIATNILGRGYLGAEIHSKDDASRVFVYLVKNTDSSAEIPNDQILVSWRLTPGLD